MDKLATLGALYPGLEVLGEGAILSGLILAATAVFVIEKDWISAASFSAAGAVLAFFGFMHGPAVGFAVTPGVALAYAMMAGLLFACARWPVLAGGTMPKAAPAAAE